MSRERTGAPLEVRWKLQGPSGRILCCRIHRHPGSGFDVLTRYDGAFVRVQWVPGLEQARTLADAWRQGILTFGGFTPLPALPTSGSEAGPQTNEHVDRAAPPR